MQKFVEDLNATSSWEWLAVLLAIAYLLLAVKESIWCWPAAFFSTAIYSVLFFDINLYMESMLNIYYIIMAIYGFYQWRCYTTQGETVKPIIRWSLTTHATIILVVSGLVMLSGYLLEKYSNQDFAYLDSFTTWFAVVTTYMVAQKVLENWCYWMVINSLSIYIFIHKGLALTAVLLMSYLVIALVGWYQWRQHYLSQDNKSADARDKSRVAVCSLNES